MVSTCWNECLPYVLEFLEQAGSKIPEVEKTKQSEKELDLTLIDTLMREKRISLRTLSEMANICKASLSYYCRGYINRQLTGMQL